MKIPILLTALLFASNLLLAQATNKIDSTGNVGIGTTDPVTQIHISNNGLSTGQFAEMALSTGGTNNYGGSIRVVNSSASPDYLRPEMTFRVQNGATYGYSNWVERMRINTNGNVGIGTSAPLSQLHVGNNNNSSGQYAEIAMTTGGSNNYGGSIRMINSSGTPDYLRPEMAFFVQNGGTFGYANWTERLRINTNGNVGIGTSSPAEKLSVNGNIVARKITVTQNAWSDYVFDSGYNLRPLSAVETFIEKHKHLPEIPSAADVALNGVDLAGNQALLLKKIEELTLYIIDLKKEVNALKNQISKNESTNLIR